MRKRAPTCGFLLASLVLGLAVGTLAAILILREWVMDVLVVRLAYYFWVMGLSLRSRPQAVYWALPIVVGIVAAILLLAYNLDLHRVSELPPVKLGRVSEWEEWLRSAKINPYFNKYLHRKMLRLTRRALQLEEQPHAGRESSHVIMPPMPPEVEILLRERRPPSFDYMATPEAWHLEDIVAYLETVLEVEDDR